MRLHRDCKAGADNDYRLFRPERNISDVRVCDGMNYVDNDNFIKWRLTMLAIYSPCVTSAVTTPEGSPDVTVYPNPFSRAVTINLSDPRRILYLEIISITGATLFRKEWTSSNGPAEINLSHLPPGMMFCKLRDDRDNVKTLKLVKVE